MKRTLPLLLLCAVLAGCQTQPPAPETPPAAVTAPAPTPTPTPLLSALVREEEFYCVMNGPSGSTLLVKAISSEEYDEMMRLMYPNGIVDSQGQEIGAVENAREVRADFIASHTKAYSVQGTELTSVPLTPFHVTFPSYTKGTQEALFYQARIGQDPFVFPSEEVGFGLPPGFTYRSEQGLFLAAIGGICRIDPVSMTAEKLTTDTYQGKTMEEVRADLKARLGDHLAWIDRWELSPDGKTLVYRTNRDTDVLNDTSIWKLDLETGEESQLIPPTLNNDLVGFLTDDHVVMGSTEDTRMAEISTGRVIPLTFPDLPNFNIRDVGGGKVIYTSYTDDTPGSTIYVGRVDTATGAVTELAHATGYFGDPVFSPGQDKVAVGYGTDPEKGTEDVLVMDLSAGTQTLLTDCPSAASPRLADDPAMEGAYIYDFLWLDNDTILVRPRLLGASSEPIPIPEATPLPSPTEEERLAAKLEFSIMIGDKTLTLGVQNGAFPWGTELETDSKEYQSSDGFHCFSFTCGETLRLGGLCLEAKGTENNGNLTRIENRNPDYKTYRGAYIGMPLEDFLELYPEAEQMNTGGIGLAYSYTDEVHCGFDGIRFTFENDLLVEFRLVNGIDGWAY